MTPFGPITEQLAAERIAGLRADASRLAATGRTRRRRWRQLPSDRRVLPRHPAA